MTDSDLALAYAQVVALEAALAGSAHDGDLDDAARAVTARRLTAPLTRQLAQWIAARACRAALAKVG